MRKTLQIFVKGEVNPYRSHVLFALLYSSVGTIWMQEILPLVLNDGDLTPIHTIPNWDRVPWLEEKRLAFVVDQLKSPRALVTHFPYHIMPPSFHTSKAKVTRWKHLVTFPCFYVSLSDHILNIEWTLHPLCCLHFVTCVSATGDLCH